MDLETNMLMITLDSETAERVAWMRQLDGDESDEECIIRLVRKAYDDDPRVKLKRSLEESERDLRNRLRELGENLP